MGCVVDVVRGIAHYYAVTFGKGSVVFLGLKG